MILAFFLLAAGVYVLYTVEPGQGPLQIPCVIYSTTGYYCSGCGITRLLHLLLHGHLWAAFRMNELVGLMAVGGAVWGAMALWNKAHHRPVPSPPLWVWMVLVAAIVLFAVLRNIPVFPFTLLAPLPLN